MSQRITIEIELLKGIFSDLNALKGQFVGLGDAVKSIEKSVGAGFQGITDQVRQVNGGLAGNADALNRIRAIDVSAIAGSFEAIGNRITETAQSGVQFETAMADLSAITGVVGDGLDVIGRNARELTKEMGGQAAGTVEAYKLALSQLTPELAKQPAVLNDMARSAILLGKTMGGDTAGAMEVLTTVMNQYAVDTSNPVRASAEMRRIMNLMAAAAKEGSAELPQLKAAMMEAGAMAKASGVSMEETAAAIEVLDKAGAKGSEGGVALRNVLATLSQGRFLPKDVQEELGRAGVNVVALGDKSRSLQDRLKLIEPVLNDTALMTKLFGRENIVGAQALVGMNDLLGEYTAKITGTNTANEQAATIMDTHAEKVSRAKSWLSDFGISVFNATQGMLPMMDAGFGAVGMLADLKNAQQGLAMVLDSKLITGLKGAFTGIQSLNVAQKLGAAWTGVITAAQWAWNVALSANPIALVVVGLAALVAGVVYAWNEFEGFREVVMGAWNVLREGFEWIMEFVQPVMGVLVAHFNLVKNAAVQAWNSVVSGVVRAGEYLQRFWQWTSAFRDRVVSIFSGLVDIILKPFRMAFETLSKIPGVASLIGAAKEAGQKVAQAFDTGAAAGRETFRRDELLAKAQTKRNAGTGVTDALSVFQASGLPSPTTSPSGGGELGGRAGSSGVTSSGNQGGQGGRNIEMNVTMNMQFGIGKDVAMDTRKVAEQVAAMLLNKLRDAQLAMG